MAEYEEYNEMKNGRWYDYRCDLVDVRFDYDAATLFKKNLREHYAMYGEDCISIGTLIDIVNNVAKASLEGKPIVYDPTYISYKYGWFINENPFEIVPIKDGTYAIKFNNVKIHAIED